MAKNKKETPEQIAEIVNKFKNDKVFVVQYLDKYNHASRIWDAKGYVKKFFLEEARAEAQEICNRTGRQTKVCKGWTVIEVFEQ